MIAQIQELPDYQLRKSTCLGPATLGVVSVWAKAAFGDAGQLERSFRPRKVPLFSGRQQKQPRNGWHPIRLKRQQANVATDDAKHKRSERQRALLTFDFAERPDIPCAALGDKPWANGARGRGIFTFSESASLNPLIFWLSLGT